MRAHTSTTQAGVGGRLGTKHSILVAAAVVLGVALIAAGASANFRSVTDPRGDTTCGHEVGGPGPCPDRVKRNADIVRATAGHDGALLMHTIRVVGKFQIASLEINTDSDPGCEFYMSIGRGVGRDVRKCTGQTSYRHVTGPARYQVHRHSVEITFSERSIGNPQSYGWAASTNAGDYHASTGDRVPNGDGYIRHGLG